MLGILTTFGEFVWYTTRPHTLSHVAVAVPSFLLCTQMCLRSTAVQFSVMSDNAYTPCTLGFCNVDRGTRNVAPYQMNHSVAVVNGCVYVPGAGKICSVYQIFVRRAMCK